MHQEEPKTHLFASAKGLNNGSEDFLQMSNGSQGAIV